MVLDPLRRYARRRTPHEEHPRQEALLDDIEREVRAVRTQRHPAGRVGN
jgi:hypothetical protein